MAIGALLLGIHFLAALDEFGVLCERRASGQNESEYQDDETAHVLLSDGCPQMCSASYRVQPEIGNAEVSARA